MSAQRPPTHDASAPSTSAAATGRNVAALLARAWRLRVSGADLVPGQGPVVLAANHTAFLDGLMLVASSPRPVHVLTEADVFMPPFDRALAAAGQIRIDPDRADRSALRRARAVLDADGVIGMFPEMRRGAGDVRHLDHSIAYLCAHSDATLVPVAILGARPHGGGRDSLPRFRSRIDVVFGDPVEVRVDGDPRRRAVLARSGERVRQILADHVRTACLRTGQTLPDPLPGTTPDHRSDS